MKLTLAIIQVALFVVLCIIAYALMKTLLQAYFLLYVGFILTGFAGSSWTASYWQSYVKSISEIAIKFLAMCLIMGVMTTEMKGWAISISNATDLPTLAGIVLRAFGSAFIIALTTYQLPEW